MVADRTACYDLINRMIITPMILVPMVALLARYDPFEAAEDPVFILTAVLIVSSPPAIVCFSPLLHWHESLSCPSLRLMSYLCQTCRPILSSRIRSFLQTLAQITQAASGDAFERLISKTIWVSYGLLTPPRKHFL